MKVEKARGSDIGPLVQLRMDYLREDLGSLDEKDAGAIAENLPAYFRAHLDRDLFCYIVRDGGEIVSCAWLLVVEKPMSPAFLNGKTGTVFNVYTRPAFRRKGYAGALIAALIADAKRMDLCSVELKATDAGVPLYLSAGFAEEHSGYRRMKWKNPERPEGR